MGRAVNGLNNAKRPRKKKTERKARKKAELLAEAKLSKNKKKSEPFEQRFLSRELGWLEFNRRVLFQAEDERTPLLERLRFLTISNTNLDEFFMKRVGGLKRQVAADVLTRTADGRTPQEQLNAIRAAVLPTMITQNRIFEKQICPQLAKAGVVIKRWHELNSGEKKTLTEFYMKSVFPILTPLSVDPGHPFPFISNLSTSLGVVLATPDHEEKFFARVKVPVVLPQWVQLHKQSEVYVALIDIIAAHLATLFPHMKVLSTTAFRLTRNAESDRDDEEAEDLLEAIEEELRQRRFAEVVRLEHSPQPDPWVRELLIKELGIEEEDVYELPSDLDFMDFSNLANIGIKSLHFQPFSPSLPIPFGDESLSIFDIIKAKDRLLHHPFENFAETVERFIREAADDPKVLAIKMTLYRTGDRSPFIKSLIRAAEEGKQVVCLVELKARFDEERNIYWAQALENAGVHVVYGIVGLKTHAKTALVVRQEADDIRCYAHIGTGNYNVSTARLYTDLGILTADPRITLELVELFHFLTGRSLKKDYQHLLVAPVNMFERFKSMIAREAEHAKAGRPAQVIAKFNNMEEDGIANALYECSAAKVPITLLIRGFTGIKPRTPGLSESIEVISIIGRFLEHSRLFYFRNGQENPLDGEFYLGSADWMYRNLHARVEVVTPVYDADSRRHLWEILQLYIKDQRQVWDMSSDGKYTLRNSNDPGVHEALIQYHRQSALKPTVFTTALAEHESAYQRSQDSSQSSDTPISSNAVRLDFENKDPKGTP